MITPVKKKEKSGKVSYNAQLQGVFGMNEMENTEIKEKDFMKNINFEYSSDELFQVESSQVKLTQVVMYSDMKKEIDLIIDEFKNKELLSGFGLSPDNKLLFHGPSGCGKTLMAYALANHLNKKLFIVNLGTIIDSGLGKTSNKIFQIFQTASLNKGILFFDEIDMLGKKRDDLNDHGEMKRVATGLLQALDFLDKDTIFIAATNFPDLVDTAILRRFSKKIEFKLPNKKELDFYIKLILKELKMKTIDNNVYDKIIGMYTKLSFAEIRDKFISRIKRYIIKNGKIATIEEDFLLLK